MPETILTSVLTATIAAFVTAIAAWAPVLGPRGRFFGVLVDPEFASSPPAGRTKRIYRTVTLCIGLAAVIALLLPLLGAPVFMVSPVLFLFTVGQAGAYVWAHGRTLEQAKKTATAETARAVKEDARHWKLGIIYFNPADPRVDVPKNYGFGSTLNMARGTSWLILSIPLFFGALLLLVVALVT